MSQPYLFVAGERMSHLIQRLAGLKCGCDKLEGRTIKKLIRERGYYYLLFTDGSWLHTDYQISDAITAIESHGIENHPLIELGLVTEDELQGYFDEVEQKLQDR